jgi:AIG2 family protein
MPLTFGYGSNMCYGRMKYRVRSLKFEDVGVLNGYRFITNKVSKDGSAKGNIEIAIGQKVFGVVFSLAEGDVAALDDAEGFGEGYVVNEGLDVRPREGKPWSEPVRVYIADSRYLAKELWPYSWYKRHIVEGALHFGLPHDYVCGLESHPSV